MVKMSGWNHYKMSWHYPDIEPARQPFPHWSCVSVPLFTFLPDLAEDDYTVNLTEAVDEDSEKRSNSSSSINNCQLGDFHTAKVELFIQGEQKDLVKVLALSKAAGFGLPSQLASCS